MHDSFLGYFLSPSYDHNIFLPIIQKDIIIYSCLEYQFLE